MIQQFLQCARGLRVIFTNTRHATNLLHRPHAKSSHALLSRPKQYIYKEAELHTEMTVEQQSKFFAAFKAKFRRWRIRALFFRRPRFTCQRRRLASTETMGDRKCLQCPLPADRRRRAPATTPQSSPWLAECLSPKPYACALALIDPAVEASAHVHQSTCDAPLTQEGKATSQSATPSPRSVPTRDRGAQKHMHRSSRHVRLQSLQAPIASGTVTGQNCECEVYKDGCWKGHMNTQKGRYRDARSPGVRTGF